MTTIQLLESDVDLQASFPIMQQLRPHLQLDTFVMTIRHLQQTQNYQLVAAINLDQIKALAGYRITENLAWGRYLYVDDLITAAESRSRGYAQRLFDWLENEAKSTGCQQLHLDSGVHRYDAHRFYLKNKMNITSHHFAIDWTEK